MAIYDLRLRREAQLQFVIILRDNLLLLDNLLSSMHELEARS